MSESLEARGQPWSQTKSNRDPSDEMADAATTLLMLCGGHTQLPTAPTIEKQDVLFCSPEGHLLSSTAEKEGARLSPGRIDKHQGAVHANARAAIPCSIHHVTDSAVDISTGQELHDADFMEAFTHWNEATWALEQETALSEATGNNHLDEDLVLASDPSRHQNIDELFYATEVAEMHQTGYFSNIDPKETLLGYQERAVIPHDATDVLGEMRSSPLLQNHRSPSNHDTLEVVPNDTERAEWSNDSVSITTHTKNIEVLVLDNSSKSNDSSDEMEGTAGDQRIWSGSQHAARSHTPLITDTNNGEVIIIDDSSNSEDSSDEMEDITKDRRTWPGSQRRARSRHQRVLHGMVQWSDARLERRNYTAIQQLWINAQKYWKSMQALKCFAKSKRVKKFDKMMIRAKKHVQKNGGTILLHHVAKLHRKFRHILPSLRMRLESSNQKKFVDNVDTTLKELYAVVEVTMLMTEQPPNDDDENDGDYRPGVATRNL
ncbi:hypothetical protein COCCADRAFT_9884 [Bipolaris zeicola 26-R-13]|uniref:Uncharacterized protein n=1 Tax=Cochliobolus carbonum (strain 26-R-13) TaxID=930089 RepID=W6XXT4_COCC2|nr:uncharacterized protein COCCADRAFT_9884 [Bipolaris zeicola 26-R-13]EUC27544.1 hypothetical protein COCCADRAFT_9884 [Bipolaris zeicola 26-R-13]